MIFFHLTYVYAFRKSAILQVCYRLVDPCITFFHSSSLVLIAFFGLNGCYHRTFCNRRFAKSASVLRDRSFHRWLQEQSAPTELDIGERCPSHMRPVTTTSKQCAQQTMRQAALNPTFHFFQKNPGHTPAIVVVKIQQS